MWPSAVRNWELLYGAKTRFHEKVSGLVDPDNNRRISSAEVSPSYGAEPVRTTSIIHESLD